MATRAMAKSAQSVMLAIHGKRTDVFDLKSPLLSYVRSTYSDREADDAADDVTMVQQLRADIAVAHAAGASSQLKDKHLKWVLCCACTPPCQCSRPPALALPSRVPCQPPQPRATTPT